MKRKTRPTLEQAKYLYVHRFTMEHIPQWALQPHASKYYAPQYRTDQEWYDNTFFSGDEGHLGTAKECTSTNQSWPLGTWLDAPYTKGMKPKSSIPFDAFKALSHTQKLALFDSLAICAAFVDLDVLRALCMWNDPNGDYDTCTRADLVEIVNNWREEEQS